MPFFMQIYSGNKRQYLQIVYTPTTFNVQYQAVGKVLYQSPLILTELFQHNLINVSYLTACYLYQVMMTLHFFLISKINLTRSFKRGQLVEDDG